MSSPSATRVATIAGRSTCVLFASSLLSCGAAGSDGGANFTAVAFGFLLFVLALAGVIVWVTARDIAGDDPPPPPNIAPDHLPTRAPPRPTRPADQP